MLTLLQVETIAWHVHIAMHARQVELFAICRTHTGHGMTHSIRRIEWHSSGWLQFWVFKCIQELMFVTPKVAAHRHYQVVQAAQQTQNKAAAYVTVV